jgi:uncharacterized protein YegL
MLLDGASSSTASAFSAIENRTTTFFEIDTITSTNERRLSEVFSSLSVLRSSLRQAIDAAAMVCFSIVT